MKKKKCSKRQGASGKSVKSKRKESLYNGYVPPVRIMDKRKINGTLTLQDIKKTRTSKTNTHERKNE